MITIIVKIDTINIYIYFIFSPIEDIGWSNRGNRGHDWTILQFFLIELKKFINDFFCD